MDSVGNAITSLFLEAISQECSQLCKLKQIDGSPSRFRNIPVKHMADFNWLDLVQELQSIAPTLFRVLSTIAIRNDHQSQKRADASHFPGICTAAAVLLKERNS